jgi:hypothetical protein|tara:strand:- start:460 stop:687 length:228 start_codon:yes stop_codon:yes gene_type:complete
LKNLLYITLIVFYSCANNEIECIDISNKYGDNGSYYFEWIRGFGENQKKAVGIVDKDTFKQYEIGDTYCVDELML